MTMYRSKYHSFWHDDPEDAGMRERYLRRIKRFKEIDARNHNAPVLFVRVAVCTEEINLAEELLAELQKLFGIESRLLLLLDGQKTRLASMRRNPNLLIYCVGDEVRTEGTGPFIQPVKDALDWVMKKPLRIEDFAQVDDLKRLLIHVSLDTTHYSEALRL